LTPQYLHPRISRHDVRLVAVQSGRVRLLAGVCAEYARKFEVQEEAGVGVKPATCTFVRRGR
jgi:hypothetical protein